MAQIIGILGVSTFLLSYQLKKRNNIIVVNAISSVLYVLQYILLGAFEGAALDILAAVSTVAAHNKDKGFIAKHTTFVITILTLSFCIAGMVFYKNIFSLCSVTGAILQNSAFWITKEKVLRRVSFAASPFWLVYNLTSGAYGSAIGSALSIVSIGLAIFRYDIWGKSPDKIITKTA
ncbi:MAG: YgjV family protein [Clostridia bacterium]|nr:YgjV family protein [Clostridia bacterium]